MSRGAVPRSREVRDRARGDDEWITHPTESADTTGAGTAAPHPASGDEHGWLTPQSIEGTGRFTMHGPKVEGDEIRFDLDGRTARTGLTYGRFSFRHHSPATKHEPAWTTRGYGRVICLSVSGDTALLTTAIQHEVNPVAPETTGPHAFYLKITDGRRDHVSFIQGPPPPAGNDYGIYGCSDPEAVPDIPIENGDRYFLDRGGWRLRGPAS